MESFVNPPEVLSAEAERRKQERKQSEQFPSQPVRDVMLFLLENAPLKPWQPDVLSIIRDEAYYFAPQGQTKIMNEGWASYWHSTIMTRQGLLPADLICYCDHHSGTMASSSTRLNPYKLGHRAVPRHRRPLEPRPLRQGIRRVRRLHGPAELGHRRRRGQAKDFRGPPHLQRSDVRRRIPDARFLPAAQAVFLRLQPRQRRLRDRKPRIPGRSRSGCCST